ncbi:MAG TPA: DNA cytosine methyltransferase [Anaerolineaceae bacterium]|nr:DNA cytosine methyltransferase [Anaerolineaceae bacterium]
MKFGSLFSGIGGFDLGFERAGMGCFWQCEIDPKARQVLKRHWDVPIYEDVKRITRQNTEAVDLICGGFPCQDVSIAGNRAGLAGKRSGLWFEFARIIELLGPKWVVVENVPGLLSSNRGRDFAVIIQWLAKCGYGVSWRILDAQYFGVPQRRRRVFIVGSLGTGDSATVLFESESLYGNIAQGEPAGQEITEVLAGGAHPGGINGRDDKNWNFVIATGQGGAEIENDKSPTLSNDHEAPIIVNKRGEKSGGGRGGLESIGVRRLSPVECARLQGFPDDWNDWLADSVRYRQYGNAVCVPVAEWIGKRIVEIAK